MKTNKGVISIGIIIAIILACLVVGGGGYYLVSQNNAGQKQVEENTEIETQEETQVSNETEIPNTYTYNNYDFSMELPKGFTPIEEQAQTGPATIITLPTGALGYISDPTFWEKYNISSYTYIKDEKIGDNTFKVYRSSGATYYWLKNGKVGYEFGGTDTVELKKIIETFKIIPEKITNNLLINNTTNSFAVVDSFTGIKVSSPQFSIKGKQFSSIDTFLAYAKSLSADTYDVDISAFGYKTLSARLAVPGNLDKMTINLDPIKTPIDAPNIPKDKFRIFGYITDAQTHDAISGALVSLQTYNMSTTSSPNGFYYFDIIPSGDGCSGLTMEFSKTNYKKYKITNFASGSLSADSGGSYINHPIILVKGDGTQTVDERHKLCN